MYRIIVEGEGLFDAILFYARNAKGEHRGRKAIIKKLEKMNRQSKKEATKRLRKMVMKELGKEAK